MTTVLTKQKDFLPSQKTQLVSTLRSAFLPVPFARKETISTQVPGPSDEPVRQVEGTKISQKDDDLDSMIRLRKKGLEYDSDLYGSKVSERPFDEQDIISIKNGLELIMQSEFNRYDSSLSYSSQTCVDLIDLEEMVKTLILGVKRIFEGML